MTQFTLSTQKFSTRMETSNTSEKNAKAMMKHDWKLDQECRFENYFFSFRVLRLFVLHWWWERPQTTICCLEWSLDRFRCVFDVFLYVCTDEGVLRIGCLLVSMLRRCITFCKACKLCSRWHWPRYRWYERVTSKTEEINWWFQKKPRNLRQ